MESNTYLSSTFPYRKTLVSFCVLLVLLLDNWKIVKIGTVIKGPSGSAEKKKNSSAVRENGSACLCLKAKQEVQRRSVHVSSESQVLRITWGHQLSSHMGIHALRRRYQCLKALWARRVGEAERGLSFKLKARGGKKWRGFGEEGKVLGHRVDIKLTFPLIYLKHLISKVGHFVWTVCQAALSWFLFTVKCRVGCIYIRTIDWKPHTSWMANGKHLTHICAYTFRWWGRILTIHQFHQTQRWHCLHGHWSD